MIGSFLTRLLLMLFGYLYPAYECFKTVEKNKPQIEHHRFWCQYWILVAMMTVFERFGDFFISWLPLYGEAKVAFFIYLWYPKIKGTAFVYDAFFKPFISQHENEIDQALMELKVRAGDMVVLSFRQAATYGQTRVFEILQFVASAQKPQATKKQAEAPAAQPSSPTSSTTAKPGPKNVVGQKASSERTGESEADSERTTTTTTLEKTSSQPPSEEIEDAIRATRGRLRKTKSIAAEN